mgnify:CR=1 FL=1
MSEDKKMITPDELKSVQKVRSKYQEITVKLGQIQVQPGVELTAAAWRVELSEPFEPLDILCGFEDLAKEKNIETPTSSKPSRF